MNLIKHNIIILLYISLLISVISCKDKYTVETEPNDSFSTATEVRINSRIEGYVNRVDDQDFYRFEIVEPIILDIQLSAVKGVNHSLKIWYYNNGKTILMKLIDDSRKSSPERICNLFCREGIYFITILHGSRDIPRSNNETPYSLILLGRDLRDNEELEVNDSPEMSNCVEFDGIISGYFSPSYYRSNEEKGNPLREEDWYYIDINLDREKPILMNVDLTGVPGINSMIYLFNPEFNEISVSDINGIGDGESLTGVGVTNSGRYYIMITSKNFGSNNDIPYNLQVNKREYDYSMEMEPNNEPENANIILDDRISGNILSEGDIDYFLYKTDDTISIHRIEITPPPGIDIKMRIYSTANRKLYEIDNSKRDHKEVMPNAFIKGDFFIEVYSGQKEYNQDQKYILNVLSMPYSDAFEIEPNDNIGKATKIKGNVIIGYISKKRDVDYYYLEYSHRVKCNFNIRGIKNSELKISVTDPLGYIIKSVTLIGNRMNNFNEMIDVKGFIIVESVSENYDEPYTINIEEI